MAARHAACAYGGMGAYEIGHIDAGQIDRAYALLRLAHPSVELNAWRRYAIDAIEGVVGEGPRRQVLVAANALDYIQGLTVSFIGQVGEVRTLDVPVFIVVSAADEAGVRSELLAHLSARAAGFGCAQLRLWAPAAENWHRHLAPDAASDARIDRAIAVQS